MKSINIEKELPELHRLGVKCGITCGIANKEDVKRLAKLCSRELAHLAEARQELNEAKRTLIEC